MVEQIERVAPGDLKPHPRNARRHSKPQIARLVESIQQFGFVKPIIADEANTILAGHGVHMAALEMGLDFVPVLRRPDLSEDQKRAYIIADNRLAELSKWDEELLEIELKSLNEVMDLGTIGFPRWTWTDRIDLKGAESVPDDVPERVESGDIWQLGRHFMRCCDSLQADCVAELMAEHRPQLMIADPPYGVSLFNALPISKQRRKKHYQEDDTKLDYTACLDGFTGDVAYIWCSYQQLTAVEAGLTRRGFNLRSLIIWGKDGPNPTRSEYNWQHEQCFYAVRKGGDSNWKNVHKTTLWSIERMKETETRHAAERPLEVHLRSIENHTSRDAWVYDPFLGSGTTIMAAEVSSRRAIGCELLPRFCDVILQRWEAATSKQARKL